MSSPPPVAPPSSMSKQPTTTDETTEKRKRMRELMVSPVQRELHLRNQRLMAYSDLIHHRANTKSKREELELYRTIRFQKYELQPISPKCQVRLVLFRSHLLINLAMKYLSQDG